LSCWCGHFLERIRVCVKIWLFELCRGRVSQNWNCFLFNGTSNWIFIVNCHSSTLICVTSLI
jgi:hypothetical protein